MSGIGAGGARNGLRCIYSRQSSSAALYRADPGPPDPGRRFWELVESRVLAAEYGIRVAQCEAPAVRMKTGQVWEVTLDAPGGLNLKMVRDPSHVADSFPPHP